MALGGNALVHEDESGSIQRQSRRAEEFATVIADLVADGWRVLLTHGNGPQVGFILRRGELAGASAELEGLPELPLWLAVADSQGGIGHMMALALDSEFDARGMPQRAAAVLTHVDVDPADPAFARPTKPIGGVMDAPTAELRRDSGWSVAETSPGHWRRVVASPQPQHVLEVEQIASLLASGAVVIAGGGGGIPVVRSQHGWSEVDAVIDKDRTSALLGAAVGIDQLVLVTGVDQVMLDFGTPHARSLGEVSAAEMAEHRKAGQFPAGSMGPKVEASLDFLAGGGGCAGITSIGSLRDALSGRAGTRIMTTQQQEAQ
ncbi:MAG: carbamate kinase [Micropruina sp.]|nr:carbamate kinase [Micropruina sp.]